jgi:subtilisin family serine protease
VELIGAKRQCAATLAWVVGMACLLLTLPGAAAAAPGARIVVKRAPGLTRAERVDVRADAGVEHVRTLRVSDAEVVAAPRADAARALRRLNADPDVVYAVRDVTLRAAAGDPDLPKQWGLVNSSDSDIDADADAAWTVTKGTGVTVAVVDTAVDGQHPDLTGNVSGGTSFVQADGCTETAPTPDHGTHVAGIVAAVQDNGIGITGVAPGAAILPVRALDNCGSGSLSWILDAFDYAGAHAQVVSASLGTDPWLPAQDRTAIGEAFRDVIESHPGALFVAAAGNEGNDNDVRPVYPCNVTSANLVCVGASGVTDTAACWSNVGHSTVDLFAPGVHIYSTAGGAYRYMDGTSMATPMVAGAAALVSSNAPGQGATAVKAALLSSVEPKSGMSAISVSGGRLNAGRAVGQSLAVGGGDGAWQSCDQDHDGVSDPDDFCPNDPGPGTSDGCPPDGDADGVPDESDNCPTAANAAQTDADRDGIGDACDPSPRGPDADGDGRAALDDACPTQYALTANGCPAATTSTSAGPAPSVTSAPKEASIAPVIKLPRSGTRARVRFTVTCDSACSGSAKLTVSKALARKLGLGRKRTLVVRRISLSQAGTKLYTLKLSRKVTRGMKRTGMRRLKTSLTVSVRDAESQRASASTAPRIRR